jgi:FkbM family methyltransferase
MDLFQHSGTLARIRGIANRALRPWARLTEHTAYGEHGGFKFYYPSRSGIGRALAREHSRDSMLQVVCSQLEGDAPFVIDVGSNIGTSLIQIKLAKPGARVLCVEPSTRYAPYLRRTIATNGWRDVELVERLLGASHGEAVLNSNTSSASVAARDYSHSDTAVGSDRLQMTTLDSLLSDKHREVALRLLKTDTDGYDFDVLLGAVGTLRKYMPPVYFEFAPFLLRGASREAHDLPRFLAALGYGSFLILESSGKPLAFTGDTETTIRLADDNHYVDVLAIPPASTALLDWAASLDPDS